MTPTREEFLHFSTGEKALFYVLIAASLLVMAAQIRTRVRMWQTGRPLEPIPNPVRYWIGNLSRYVLGQKSVRASRPRCGAPMHLLIFYGFLALTIATTLLAINTYSPIKFHQGNYYLLFEFTFDTLGLLLLFGLVWAISRRLTTQAPIAKQGSDLGILVLLLLITVNGYLLEAGRIANNPQPWDSWSWVGYGMAKLLPVVSEPGYKALWWFHIVLVMAFFAVLPQLRIRHVLLAIAATAQPPARPMGALRTIPMEEVEQTEQVGSKFAKDYSRWHLMSLDACMECGRCTEVCPAWNVGKVLNPKQVVQDARAAMASGEALAPRITEEALWQCTTCNACQEACPVLIRHVDLITDVRRNLVSEGELSGSAAVMLRQTASTKSAWGSPVREREKWMEGRDIPLCRDGKSFEFLFWVGCAGATDPAAMKTTQAVADLLKKAGISFACLGQEEACTGDPARRVGEEFLFQDRATENQSVFERYGVKKIVTACPHCFNSLKNEYGEFGAQLEVYHHTQLLQTLVSKGQLLAAKPNRRTVLHDPCYLTRVNGEVAAPRALVQGMLEPEFAGVKTRCCGAGGGRMWMDEPPEHRPATARMEQLMATGATQVAVACPFCRIMLDTGTSDDSIRLVDLAQLMQEANSEPAGSAKMENA